ncbi:class I SAM-dependent methyltransferase [Pseudoruegeria sp. SK021]|uniref:class I SAM-dependent methyltransferase n=1 Tax=Pseudoruegeria sp. SK021 TaxID=1933035 RepID=UPI000A24DEC2|nr:SAM-dependent methyltransferase [Pseudoruegeria sp. SK021]OSP54187.1 methyltransferase [Pseudoruegeria sp. SK021]
MTALTEIIARRIAAVGPMTLADYMAECLLHPVHGYYTTRPPFGAEGDFITAPEISQMFGEMLGLSLAMAWLDQGAPSPVALTELGPGRGTLMADMLRAVRNVPGLSDAVEVHLVEASPRLRLAQERTLAGYAVQWHDRIEDLPEMPLLLVANEFFDALPIRQFTRSSGGWRETQIVQEAGTLRFALGLTTRPGFLEHRIRDTVESDVVEHCPAAGPIMTVLARRIATHGGAALIVDYGGWHSLGDTFQALRHHAPEDPLARPGAADLTAHVDFEALAFAARVVPDIQLSALTPQGVLLERLGITARAQVLARGLTGAALEAHVAAHRRLTHPEEMGSLFNCIALTPGGSQLPPGLTA